MPLHCRVAIVILALLASLNASAHAILTESTPKLNGSVSAGHQALALKYNSKIDQGRSRLVLIAADKSETPLAITAHADKPNELDSAADLKPGTYVIRWQALALDGHITRGDLPFTVTAAP
ncbi:copper resistance CopC family protein [Dyella telluris]|uniref:Copper resistance protein C n=1 Tax=Dyella telluris TaxID=2763498 RepID=A0A7G8Q317_9GAMM|nr:copper resistance CopC family protein [Dyella telluris]QNK01175.1 copper resistance protein CopC [Dyella telluris]